MCETKNKKEKKRKKKRETETDTHTQREREREEGGKRETVSEGESEVCGHPRSSHKELPFHVMCHSVCVMGGCVMGCVHTLHNHTLVCPHES